MMRNSPAGLSRFLFFSLFGIFSASFAFADLRTPNHSHIGPSDIVDVPGAAKVKTPQPRDPKDFPQGYYPGDPLPPKTVYLSFDDGPSDFTSQVLDILEKENVRATFFINSFDRSKKTASSHDNYLLRYADQLKRMVADGDVIGNHTFSHQDLGRLSPRQINFQLSTLQNQLAAALGPQMPKIHLIRPPFGSPWLGNWNTEAQRIRVTSLVGGRGIIMLWTPAWDSSDSEEWVKGEWFNSSSPRYHPWGQNYLAKMNREFFRLIKHADGVNGGIILMHDDHPTSRDILEKTITQLKERGYSFATLEDYCRWRWGPDVFDRFDKTVASTPAPTAPAPATATPIGAK